jgi:hypothetical protein
LESGKIKVGLEMQRFGQPDGWNEEESGKCHSLEVYPTLAGPNAVLYSVWFPSQEELKALSMGCPVILGVWGTGMPPVAVGVDDTWEIAEPPQHSS